MQKRLFGFVLMVTVLSGSLAEAYDWNAWWSLGKCWPHCTHMTCCDDYCPKAAPQVKKVHCFTCDDYCPKCAPGVQEVRCFGCDDYRAKCPPAIRCPACDAPRCVPVDAHACKRTGGTACVKPRVCGTR